MCIENLLFSSPWDSLYNYFIIVSIYQIGMLKYSEVK